MLNFTFFHTAIKEYKAVSNVNLAFLDNVIHGIRDIHFKPK